MCKTAVDGGEWYDDADIEHDAGVAGREMVRGDELYAALM